VEFLEFKNPSSVRSEQGGVSRDSTTSPRQSIETLGSSGQAETVNNGNQSSGNLQPKQLTQAFLLRTAWVRVSAAGVESNTSQVYTPGRQEEDVQVGVKSQTYFTHAIHSACRNWNGYHEFNEIKTSQDGR